MKRRVILMGTIVSIVGLAFLMYGINPATPATHDGLAWGGPVTTSALQRRAHRRQRALPNDTVVSSLVARPRLVRPRRPAHRSRPVRP